MGAKNLFVASEDQWALEIGRFVIAFGSIEAMTYELLRHTLRYNVAQVLIDANTPLGQRLDLLIAMSQERDGHEWVELGEVLTRIKALARKRNLIAHNGVTFEMFIGENGELDFEEVIRNRKLRGSLHEKTPPGTAWRLKN